MIMDLSSCARLINLPFFVAVTDVCVVFAVRTSPDEEKRCCVCGDAASGSSAQHPAVSSLTVRRTVTSISSASLGKVSKFSSGARSLCNRNILWGSAAFC